MDSTLYLYRFYFCCFWGFDLCAWWQSQVSVTTGCFWLCQFTLFYCQAFAVSRLPLTLCSGWFRTGQSCRSLSPDTSTFLARRAVPPPR